MLSVGGPGSNLNFVLNVGGGGNTISAGGPGNLNAGFNFFGNTNTVAAGPGPLALAGSVFKDGLTVTKTNPGIAINNFRIGGAAATSGQSSTVPKAKRSARKHDGVGRTKTVNAAGATTGSNKKISKATVKAAGTTTGSNKKTSKATVKPAGATTGSNKK